MRWTGWVEEQVRRITSSAGTSNMGFTAINNASAPAAPASPPATIADTSEDVIGTAKSVVSQYLGRGETQPDEQHAATTKKAPAKGKKRAAATSDNTRSKKRRKSSVRDSLKVSKQADPQAIEMSNGKPKASNTNAKSGTRKQRVAAHSEDCTKDGVSMTAGDVAPTATKSISVYAPATSMDALDSTSAQTSVNSVKANAGKSFTLYQGNSHSSSVAANIEVSQPWLKPSARASVTTHHGNTEDALQGSDIVASGSAVHCADRRPQQATPNQKRGHTSVKADSRTAKGTRGKATKKPTSDTTSAFGNAQGAKPISTATQAEVSQTTESPPNGSEGTADHPVLIEEATGDPRRSARPATSTAPHARASFDDSSDTEDFSDVDDEELVNFAQAVEEAVQERTSTPPTRSRKDNMRDVDEHEDYGGALLSQAEKDLIKQLKSKNSTAVKPIVRKPFPSAVLDRSPIFGASNGTLLRTCFRVGEALNTGSQAVRCGNEVVIELYARVTASWREPKPSRKQHFIFKDLYHDKPPFMEGTFELWDQSALWDLDSKPFLSAKNGPGMISRTIGKLRRTEQKWKIEILSIWEASWEDVNYVAGIYTDRLPGDENEDQDD